MTLRQLVLSQSRDKNWNFYRKLRDLYAHGYIELKRGSDENFKYQVWQLTKKGFEYIVESLHVVLKENGFASENVFHDYLVTAFHVGEWMFVQPPQVELFSEQELRRNWPSNYPNWVPEIQVHRPDGYTLLKDGKNKKLIAIEVEISAKNFEIYQEVASFYDDMENITSVLWLVRSKSLMEKIQKAVYSRRGKRPGIHNFVLLEDFKKQFWNAKIIEGSEKGYSIHEYYCNIHCNIDYQISAILGNSDAFLTFLKPVKSPYGMKAYVDSVNARKAD